MKSFCILLLLMTLVPLISQAQEEDQDEMETDRPSLSFTPKTVVKNRFQLEAGFQKQYDKTNGQRMEEYLYPTVFLKYGLTKKLELHVLIEHLKALVFLLNYLKLFVEIGFFISLSLTKEKEVFMQSTDSSWKPSVIIE